jgi:hypothetical protein
LGEARTDHTQRLHPTERRHGSAELCDHSIDTAEYHNFIASPITPR